MTTWGEKEEAKINISDITWHFIDLTDHTQCIEWRNSPRPNGRGPLVVDLGGRGGGGERGSCPL